MKKKRNLANFNCLANFIYLAAVLFPLLAHSQCVTNLLVTAGPCDAEGQVMLDIDVYAESELVGQDFDLNFLITARGTSFNTFTYTGTPTRISLQHRGCGEAQFEVGACGLVTNVPMPSCPQAWAITEFAQISATPTPSGELELVTKVVAEFPQSEGVFFLDYRDPRPVFNGTNIYTNVVATPIQVGAFFTATIQADITSIFRLGQHCYDAVLAFDTVEYCAANGCPYISGADFTFDSCNPDGTSTATVEIEHRNLPTDAMIIIRVSDDVILGSFPVAGSPQTESFLMLPPELFFNRFIFEVFSPSLDRVLFRRSIESVDDPDCSREPCEILELRVVETSACRPDGFTEVKVRTRNRNCSRFDRVRLIATSQTAPGFYDEWVVFTNNIATNTFYLPGPGSWTIRSDLPFVAGEGSTTSMVEVAGCPTLTEIISLDALAVSDCVAGGNVEVTFALTASNALGLSFAFWSSGFPPFVLTVDKTCFVYTNTPTIFRALVPARGTSFPASIALVYPGTIDHRQDVYLRVDDIVTLPNCFETPPVCVLFPPRIVSAKIESDRGRLSFMVPLNTGYRIEQTDNLNEPWTLHSEGITLVSSNKTRNVSLPPSGTRFYRVRCDPSPIPVP